MNKNNITKIKIEQEIFEILKDKVKNLPQKEAQKIIEEEIFKRKYLVDDCHIYYASQRIKEMIDNYSFAVASKNGLRPNKKMMSILSIPIMFSAYFITIAFGLISAFIAIGGLLLAYLSGCWLATWYSKKRNNQTLKNIICWINLISWIIPGVGFFVAGTTLSFYEIEKNKKYERWGIIGLTMSSVAIFILSYSWYNKI